MKIITKASLLSSLLISTVIHSVKSKVGTSKDIAGKNYHQSGTSYEVRRNHFLEQDDETAMTAEEGGARKLQEFEIVTYTGANVDRAFDILNSLGYSVTKFEDWEDIRDGGLLSGGAPAFDVLVLGSLGINGKIKELVDQIGLYVAAGGNIVTGWDGAMPFFSEKADVHSNYRDCWQLSWFAGVVGGFYQSNVDFPIDFVDTGHPTLQDLPNHFENGQRFFAWVQNPDSALSVIATYEGDGSEGNPVGNNNVLLVGCYGTSRVVFAMWHFTKEMHLSPDNQQFLRNAVEYAAMGADCMDSSNSNSGSSSGSSSEDSRSRLRRHH